MGSAQRERARDPGEEKTNNKPVASPRKEATFPSLRLTSPRINYALPRQHSNHNALARSAVAARAKKKKNCQQTIGASNAAAADDKEPHTAGCGFCFFSFRCNRHLRRKSARNKILDALFACTYLHRRVRSRPLRLLTLPNTHHHYTRASHLRSSTAHSRARRQIGRRLVGCSVVTPGFLFFLFSSHSRCRGLCHSTVNVFFFLSEKIRFSNTSARKNSCCVTICHE